MCKVQICRSFLMEIEQMICMDLFFINSNVVNRGSYLVNISMIEKMISFYRYIEKQLKQSHC